MRLDVAVCVVWCTAAHSLAELFATLSGRPAPKVGQLDQDIVLAVIT